MTEKLLTTKEAAKKLQMAHGTLKAWRHLGKGPRFAKIGERVIRYKESDLTNFINQKRGKK